MSHRAWGRPPIWLVVCTLAACGEEELALNPLPVSASGAAATAGNASGGMSALSGAAGAAVVATAASGGRDQAQGGASDGVEMGVSSECLADPDCPEGRPRCLDTRHVCVECLGASDCASLADVCDAVTRTCTEPCRTAADCEQGDAPFCAARGVCAECLTDTDCGDGKHCDPTTNRCRDCVSDLDCESGERCDRTTGDCQSAR